MTANYIEELDASAVSRKVLTELLDTDKHAPAGVLYANGAIVTTAAPLPVGGTTLGNIETELTAIKTSAQLLDNAISGSEMQVDIVSGTVTATGSVSFGVPVGATRTQKQLRLTALTTSTDLWSPASGKRIAVKQLTITWQGANACRLTIWQGASADVTLSDTEPFLFDHTLDASANGGVTISWPDGYPWETNTSDHELHVTLSANKTVWIGVVGDERT